MVKEKLCVKCGGKPIHNKGRSLCVNCYQYLQRTGGLHANPAQFRTVMQHHTRRDMLFIKNFFTHNDWVYQPAIFYFDDEKYKPDFYDAVRNVFIEVSGTRQAYHQNKEKYANFAKTYPQIKFEIRSPCGKLLKHLVSGDRWKVQKETTINTDAGSSWVKQKGD